ncbi:hypothetical protein J1N35_000993 [Gossypium stocksii]|uniref:Uncharacterized protein n=1 Tax=Gossypium stocksii TaxID=47602 RepID=A0A9D4AJ66_9ROSI|nr:hypothetical protein J1N35_000993 [Gossypium stocksii]
MFRLIMPRKRTHASTQIEESQNKFHCEEAKARYKGIFKNQQMHPEKGFTLKESKPSVDEELVREFYANLISSELTEVSVRGIKVPITSNAINEFFELPDFKNDEYSSLMSHIESKNLQEILEELTVQEIEPMQSAKIPDKVEPMEPVTKRDIATSMFKTQCLAQIFEMSCQS